MTASPLLYPLRTGLPSHGPLYMIPGGRKRVSANCTTAIAKLQHLRNLIPIVVRLFVDDHGVHSVTLRLWDERRPPGAGLAPSMPFSRQRHSASALNKLKCITWRIFSDFAACHLAPRTPHHWRQWRRNRRLLAGNQQGRQRGQRRQQPPELLAHISSNLHHITQRRVDTRSMAQKTALLSTQALAYGKWASVEKGSPGMSSMLTARRGMPCGGSTGLPTPVKGPKRTQFCKSGSRPD